ncbi:MAG: hypothetical protein CM15mP85_04710 [Rhodobacterales bacterium]|nr:MAG: hypothetical protein CM15mP85_04710 [Rhodobacterales bacterium]
METLTWQKNLQQAATAMLAKQRGQRGPQLPSKASLSRMGKQKGLGVCAPKGEKKKRGQMEKPTVWGASLTRKNNKGSKAWTSCNGKKAIQAGEDLLLAWRIPSVWDFFGKKGVLKGLGCDGLP